MALITQVVLSVLELSCTCDGLKAHKVHYARKGIKPLLHLWGKEQARFWAQEPDFTISLQSKEESGEE